MKFKSLVCFIVILIFASCDNKEFEKDLITKNVNYEISDSVIYYADYDFFEAIPLGSITAEEAKITFNYYKIKSSETFTILYNNYDTLDSYNIVKIKNKNVFYKEANVFDKKKEIILFSDANKIYKAGVITETRDSKKLSYLEELIVISKDSVVEKFIFSSHNRINISGREMLLDLIQGISSEAFEKNPCYEEYYKYSLEIIGDILHFKGYCKFKDEDNAIKKEEFKECYNVGEFKMALWIFYGEAIFRKIEC